MPDPQHAIQSACNQISMQSNQLAIKSACNQLAIRPHLMPDPLAVKDDQLASSRRNHDLWGKGSGRRGEHLHASVHAPASSRRAHDLLAAHARDERPATPRHIPIVLIRIPDEGHNQHALSMQWRPASPRTFQFPNRPHHATISMQSSRIQDQRESARVVVAIAVEVPLVACVARWVGGHEDGVRHLMRDVIDVQSVCNHHVISQAGIVESIVTPAGARRRPRRLWRSTAQRSPPIPPPPLPMASHADGCPRALHADGCPRTLHADGCPMVAAAGTGSPPEAAAEA